MASFGVVCPGRPCQTDFRQIDSGKFVLEIPIPAQVPDLTFFLLPGITLPANMGAVLYYSLPPFQTWELLGALVNEKPSGVFRTGWTIIDGIVNMQVIQIGVSLESLDVITNLDLTTSGVEERRVFAHKIALDLFRFITSFARGEVLVLPGNALDQWLEKFDRRFRLDPSFLFKQD